MRAPPTVLSSLPKAVLAAAATYQVDSRALSEAAGLDSTLLDAPGGRIPDAAVLRLWTLAIEATGDPCLGLIAAGHTRPTSFHALGFAWLASPTLGDVLRRLMRYQRAVLNAHWMTLERDGDRVALRISFPSEEEPAVSCRADAALGTLVRWCRMLTDEDFEPAGVTLRHGDHGARRRYEEVFGPNLEFGAPADALWFDERSLARALPGGNFPLAAEADRIIEAYLARVTDAPTSRRVRELIVDLLPQGEADLEHVAARLFTSVRSLQRHLEEEGETFRGLLDATRKALAMDYVRAGEHPLVEVAFRTGFSDQSAFAKAFRRWTGTSPKSYAGAAARR